MIWFISAYVSSSYFTFHTTSQQNNVMSNQHRWLVQWRTIEIVEGAKTSSSTSVLCQDLHLISSTFSTNPFLFFSREISVSFIARSSFVLDALDTIIESKLCCWSMQSMSINFVRCFFDYEIKKREKECLLFFLPKNRSLGMFSSLVSLLFYYESIQWRNCTRSSEWISTIEDEKGYRVEFQFYSMFRGKELFVIDAFVAKRRREREIQDSVLIGLTNQRE